MDLEVSEEICVTSQIECEDVVNDEPIDLIVCRLCGQKSSDQIDLFGEVGKERKVKQKAKQCLPILISKDDELPKSICSDCCDRLDDVYSFFKMCLNTTKQLLLQIRKNKINGIDLTSHVNQYVRSYNPPTTPRFNVKVLKLGGQRFSEGFVEDTDNIQPSDVHSPDVEKIETIVEIQEKEETLETQYESINEDEFVSSFVVNMDDLKKLPKVPPKRRKNCAPRRYNPDGSIFDPFFDDPDKALDKKPSRKEISCRSLRLLCQTALKTCAMCEEEFQTQPALQLHWESTHPDDKMFYKCLEEKIDTQERCTYETIDEKDFLNHSTEHVISDAVDKDVKCKECGKMYSRSYLINHHMSVHSTKRNFKCGMCGKDFKTDTNLKAHIKSHEPDETKRTFCCEQCGKRFSYRASLDTHLRVHSGEKPFSCEICDKPFAHKGNLEEHRRVHTGERPYVCELCGTTFKRAGEIKMHLRVAHTGDRPYKCSFCDKTFQYSNLLKRHELIHSGIKPHSCPHCGKSFTQRDKMLVHTRLHTGERPYVCDICNKGFCESGNLRKHMKVHGKIPPTSNNRNSKGRPESS